MSTSIDLICLGFQVSICKLCKKDGSKNFILEQVVALFMYS
jgi:hypothetical protein